MITPDAAIAGRLNLRTLRLSRLVRITKVDTQIIRLTDHDSTLEFDEAGDGVLVNYAPGAAPNMESQREAAGMQDNSTSFSGFILDSSAITYDDLRIGLFRRAKVDLWVVDNRYPWAGYLWHEVYWIHHLEYSGENWQAQLRGVSGQLDVKIGRTYEARCDATFGDSRCGLSLVPFTKTGMVTAVDSLLAGDDNPRQRFECSGDASTQAPKYFKDGVMTWSSGANAIAGLAFDVKLSNGTLIELWTPTPWDIEVGDTFTAVKGCNKSLHDHCRKEHSNVENHRGPGTYMPTMKKILKTPNEQS